MCWVGRAPTRPDWEERDVVSKGFRVIVEDLDSGQVTTRTVHAGDYILIPFAPCYLAGEQVLPDWPEMWMNRPRAREIRTWRVGLALSLRGVAGTASAAYRVSYGDRHSFGLALCRAAATLLGENPDDAPWSSALPVDQATPG